MTLALDTDPDPLPHAPLREAQPVAVNAGRSVPAAALTDRALADWVRSHGISVTARGEDDLDSVQYRGVRAVQVVYRCGPATDPLRRAVALGVSRFIVSTPQQMARLAECAHSTKYLYLDEQAPLMVGDRRLKVVGLHTDVDELGSAADWATAARRLVCRSAVLRACGSTIKRITLTGGSVQLWRDTQASSPLVGAVDEALRDECPRWQLPRPAVTLAAATTATGATSP